MEPDSPMTIQYYRVGGWVRDRLLGVKSKDIDYAVEAPSFTAMRDDIIANGGKIFVEHPQFLTIRAKMDGEDADFVLCRKEGTYGDGRRPDSVEPGTIFDDLARRDFTVNAIAMQKDGTIFDPFNGRCDLAQKKLRCVGDAYERFDEDALRMLRAIRFSITKGLSIDGEICSCLDNSALIAKLETISVERIREELNKCFSHSTYQTLDFLTAYSDLRDAIFCAPRIGLQVHLST